MIDITSIAKTDRNDKNVTRIGRSAFIVRKVGPADFQVEDTRKWDPIVISGITSRGYALERVGELLAADRAQRA